LWRWHIVRIRFDISSAAVAFDVLVLFLSMDFLMYVSHRLAHHPWVFDIIHATHHRYENPRPLTVFALNPAEVLGVGCLWRMVIALYPSSWLGIVIYLSLNVAFGLIGHLGVEPFPRLWLGTPLVRLISTSTFHAEHHNDKDHNYGFYTVIWDELFRTQAPTYSSHFRKATGGEVQ
jgi:sterol desaturase/sphingolipid hydroxylase (fatty acid hydroxylase superfamily)